VECHETAIAEVLKTAEDRHAQELKNTYLITCPKRRMSTEHGPKLVILEGVPIYHPKRRRMDLAVPLAPPPTKASDIEPLIPLTQPPPREEVDQRPSSIEGPQDRQNEAALSDEVD